MMISAAVVQPAFGWLMDLEAARWVFWISAGFVAAALFSFAGARAASTAPSN
jgi:hypothetical protein